ncbi:MAG: glycine--tRNA ligase, partial [Patescibacteria group bacterium]
MDTITSLAKRRGFVFPGSEIYGGLAGTWDYGPYGVDLKRNVKNLWWKMFVDDRDDIYGVDSAILMNAKVWEASGHTGAGFTDPVVECTKCRHRFRSDQLKDAKKCPDCGEALGAERRFNLMFETKVGAEGAQTSYLRPETAQGIFVNFKNVVDSLHPSMPFGIAQIGKAFRNEIAPRDFVFRAREFEQMEIEYFIREADWEWHFDYWQKELRRFIEAVGIAPTKVHEVEVPTSDRAHYSKRTVDFEFDFPFGRKELYGLAYRTDFDLRNHAHHSGASLVYPDEKTGEPFIPHVIEPSLGVDRTILAILCSAYREDTLGGEKRAYLAL